jgi:hypothetical protein
MAYRSSHKHIPSMTADIFDGSHYQSLRRSKVKIDGQELGSLLFFGRP